MFKKTLISVKLDVLKLAKGIKKGNCYLKVAFPKDMPREERDDIRNRLNQIVDDIRKYL